MEHSCSGSVGMSVGQRRLHHNSSFRFHFFFSCLSFSLSLRVLVIHFIHPHAESFCRNVIRYYSLLNAGAMVTRAQNMFIDNTKK